MSLMDIKNLIIFLADDDKDDRSLLSDALLELSPTVKLKTFDNGVDLMASLLERERSLPDIIFLDLNMPLMTGEECLEDIRNERQLAKIPVVIYSGYHDDHKIRLLQKKGADRFLQKPNSYLELQALLLRSITCLTTNNSNEDFVIASKNKPSISFPTDLRTSND